MRNGFVAVCLVGLIACGGKGGGAAEPNAKADCAAAANGLLVVGKMKPDDPKAAPIRDGLVKRCIEDEWSDRATTCLGGATDKLALKECRYRFLTGLQSDGLDKQAGELLSPIEPLIARMNEFKNQMCACKDAACARKVSDDMTDWSREIAKDDEEPPKLTDDQSKRATDIGMAMSECMQKVMGSEWGDDPPPPEAED